MLILQHLSNRRRQSILARRLINFGKPLFPVIKLWFLVMDRTQKEKFQVTLAPKQSKIETSSARHWPDL